MKTIVLTGGGTAGHVNPNIALLPHLRAEGLHIEYIGGKKGIEKELIEPLLPYHGISSGKLRRYFAWKNFTDSFRVIVGVFQAIGLLGRIRPALVFSKGGFVSVPVVLAAALRRIPVIIHESDYTPGLANKICLKFAKVACTTFPETAKMLGDKGVHTEAPLRDSLFHGDKARALEKFGFTGLKPVLLVMGGSLGAEAVNICLRKALDRLLPAYDILHLCGKGNLDPDFADTPGYRQYEYLEEDLPDAFALCDIMLSRAGSGALSEILALKKPAVLIPYPKTASRGDQIRNSESFAGRGLARVVLQENMDENSLVDALADLYADRETLIAALARENAMDGCGAVMEQIRRFL